MSISVEKKENKGGTFYDLTIDGVTIYGCQRKTGNGPNGDYDFIAMPQRQYTDSAGNKKYAKIISLEKELSKEVLQVVKESEGDDSASIE